MGKAAIDLNSDLGENYGAFQLRSSEKLLDHISSVNIACGYHAGDPLEMNRIVRLASSHRVNCGAHPGYPDLMGFGRRSMAVNGKELRCYLVYQIGSLNGIAKANEVALTHVKPHGSLYLEAAKNETVADAIAEAISTINKDLIYMVLGGKGGEQMARKGRERGLRVVTEAFPGRAYNPDGTLVDRSLEGAVISDPAEIVKRTKMIVEKNCVQAIDNTYIELEVDSICLPSEGLGMVEVAEMIREVLAKMQINIRPLTDLV